MPVVCDATTLAEAASCYCYDPVTREKVKVYLLAVLAGKDNLTAAQLADAAACYCFDAVTMKKVMAYLACEGGGSPTPSTCENIEGAGDPT